MELTNMTTKEIQQYCNDHYVYTYEKSVRACISSYRKYYKREPRKISTGLGFIGVHEMNCLIIE